MSFIKGLPVLISHTFVFFIVMLKLFLVFLLVIDKIWKKWPFRKFP